MTDPTNFDELPRAATESAAPFYKRILNPYWAVAACCLLFAVGLFVSAIRQTGPRLEIQFNQGHGIKPGDRLRHRGIDIGEIRAVELMPDFSGIQVSLSLAPNAGGVAREGSLFWIERPQIGIGRIRGLDTVVGAKYVSVLPGKADAPRQFSFRGEEHPLAVEGAELREITIRFQHGNGLVVGDPLRHRGIRVGEVVGIELVPDLSRVEVRLRLEGLASGLARAGSYFWVERPRLNLSGVRGLETVVGGRYVAVRPGPETAAEVALFDGLESPPVSRTVGLEVVLESAERFGVEVGAPVTYRGMQVGSVIVVRLAADSTRIEVNAQIESDYRALVCQGTRFWSTGGIGINFGLTGVELNAETLQTIAAGGIAFATPEDPGEAVSTGHRFVLTKNSEPGWLDWSPRLPSGPTHLPDGLKLPAPEPMTLRWQVQQLGWRRQQQRHGLALLLSDGRWLVTSDLLSPPSDAVPDSPRLELAGQQHPFDPAARGQLGDATTYRLAGPLAGRPQWPVDQVRRPTAPEDCLIVTGDGTKLVPLPAHRINATDDVWLIEPSFTVAQEWHGASIVAAADGQLVAILEVDEREGTAQAILLSTDGL